MEQPTHSPANPADRPRSRPERFLLPLIFAVFVLLVLTDMIPPLRDAKEQLLHPAEYQARKACHAAALAAAERPAYARIVAPGEVHATQDAQYVRGVRVGEMGQAGAEVTYDFSCYVEAGGKLVNTHKQPSAPPTKN